MYNVGTLIVLIQSATKMTSSVPLKLKHMGSSGNIFKYLFQGSVGIHQASSNSMSQFIPYYSKLSKGENRLKMTC